VGELERDVGQALKKLEEGGLTKKEIKDILKRCFNFIDMCKYEYGEDITEEY
jgi:hypothetical protein